ncbi:MAG TPA: hypothetical protein VGP70_24360 [Actinomadura sp.]|nr:hypothetical protein [Actinomadura sp.]
MGDWFQTIGDIEATPDEAEKLAAAVLTWLVEAGIVAAERTDCVLGSDLGYPPGAKYTDAVTEPDPSLTKRWTNGLEILTGRTIFDFGQGEIERAECPHCRTSTRFLDDRGKFHYEAWGPFSEVVDAWHKDGDGLFTCRACEKPVRLNEWNWEPAWGFGDLGFMFWNWPPLKPGFVAEFSRRLEHRIVSPAGKL